MILLNINYLMSWIFFGGVCTVLCRFISGRCGFPLLSVSIFFSSCWSLPPTNMCTAFPKQIFILICRCAIPLIHNQNGKTKRSENKHQNKINDKRNERTNENGIDNESERDRACEGENESKIVNFIGVKRHSDDFHTKCQMKRS